MRYRLLLTVAVAVAATDALTKAAAVALSRWMPVHLPGGWVLRVAHNNGVIGGGGAGTVLPVVFAWVSAAEFACLLFVNRRQHGWPVTVALGLILGALAGNVGEDRIFGYVVDWITPPLHLPGHGIIVFNLADVAVACGLVLLLALTVCGRASLARARPAVTR